MGSQNLVPHLGIETFSFFDIVEISGRDKIWSGYRSSNSNSPNGSPWKYLKSHTGIVIACVCLCVHVCINDLLVCAITRDPFKIGSPNLDQKHERCKTPWLTYWGRVTHICVCNLTIFGSENGLLAPSHYLNQSWIIVNWTPRNKFSEMLIEIHSFSFKKIHFEMAAILSQPQCVKVADISGAVDLQLQGQITNTKSKFAPFLRLTAP